MIWEMKQNIIEGKSELLVLNPFSLNLCFGIVKWLDIDDIDGFELLKRGGLMIEDWYLIVCIYA